jgi:hypothetical protein
VLLGAIMSFAAFVIARDTWFSCNVMYFACGSTDYCETLGLLTYTADLLTTDLLTYRASLVGLLGLLEARINRKLW